MKITKIFIAMLIMMIGQLTLLSQYSFSDVSMVQCTEVKNQARTGTCWSFATASFLESELQRMGKGTVNLSEMYVVRSIYKDKAMNYMMRQGKANFSQGSLAHDLIRIISKSGIVPESAYNGRLKAKAAYDHSEMEAGLKGFLDGVRTQKRLSPTWKVAFNDILDAYMGTVPDKFEVDGKTHDAKSFAKALGLNVADYVSITSFSHHPFNESFILEIPDNYSNGSFYNVPLDDMMASIDAALSRGYSISWDGDVSEHGFSSNDGIAILPKDREDDIFEKPGLEWKVTQANRQANFESYSTTDDHLMHIVGTTIDQNGTKYYIVKNSWGIRGPYDGFVYMSEAYIRMKTISVMMHQDALTFELGD